MASEIAVDVTLPFLTVEVLAERANALVGDVVLPIFGVSGNSGHTNTLAGHVSLSLGLRSRGRIRWKAAIYSLTGAVRANGTAIFCFVGPPDRTVEWWVKSGSGVLYPYKDYTDELGRASCRYDPDGYSGMLTIEVRYGR